MNCPKCQHKEACHGPRGCVRCDCDMTPAQIKAEASECACLQYEGDNPNCKVHFPEARDVVSS